MLIKTQYISKQNFRVKNAARYYLSSGLAQFKEKCELSSVLSSAKKIRTSSSQFSSIFFPSSSVQLSSAQICPVPVQFNSVQFKF